MNKKLILAVVLLVGITPYLSAQGNLLKAGEQAVVAAGEKEVPAAIGSAVTRQMIGVAGSPIIQSVTNQPKGLVFPAGKGNVAKSSETGKFTAQIAATIEEAIKTAEQMTSAQEEARKKETFIREIEKLAPFPVSLQENYKNIIAEVIKNSDLIPQEKQALWNFFKGTSVNFESQQTAEFFSNPTAVVDVENLREIKKIMEALPRTGSRTLFARIIVRDSKLMPEVEISHVITSGAELEAVLRDALAGAKYTGEDVTNGLQGKRVRFGQHEKFIPEDAQTTPALHVHVEQLAPAKMLLGYHSAYAEAPIWLNASYKLVINEEVLLKILDKTPNVLLAILPEAEKLAWLEELCADKKFRREKVAMLANNLRDYYGAAANREVALNNLYIMLYHKQPPFIGWPVELEEQVLKDAADKVVGALQETARNGSSGIQGKMYNKLLENAKNHMLNMPPNQVVQYVIDILKKLSL